MSAHGARLEVTGVSGGLRVAGEIDASTVGKLASRLDPLPGAAGTIALDFAAVTFIDSSGLRVLIDAHRRAEEANRRLELAEPSSVVCRLLEISGLADYLHVRT